MKHSAVFNTLLATSLLLCSGCRKGTSSQAGSERSRPAKPGEHLGKPFKIKEVTPLGKLFADPASLLGKTVRVKGTVQAFCHHRKAWFGLVDRPKGQILRVWCRPSFRVPDGVTCGKSTAEAEGVLEEKTVPERLAQHLAREHGLFGGQPARIRGPQKILHLRATGASFR